MSATFLPADAHAAAATPSAPDTHAAFVQQTMQWREQRVARLRKPDGWLSLVGLHWIDPGVHQIGMADSNDVQLRTGPAKLGTLTLKDGNASFKPDRAAGATIDGKPADGEIVLRTDATTDDRGPSIVAFNKGNANFQVIERDHRFALRVKDANAPTRTGFVGIDYFDPDPAWRFVAKFEPHAKGQTIKVASVINTVDDMANPGTVVFQKDGKTYRLEAVDEGDGQLFLIYADHTNGKTTYGAGRFLYADPPKDGMTVVDFNQSYNPPCVFTHYATCPLPPPENRLDLTITAGEKAYRGAVHHDEPVAGAKAVKSS
ncbi:MAG TPA: DUF1684 domain-containing protein [Xanthomonadaceae bacterium]|jgi:uncharacterized protein (DUF1684 family)|nr:DUF1684 domain-containing protein [Xanthomonadaceae bacterium]